MRRTTHGILALGLTAAATVAGLAAGAPAQAASCAANYVCIYENKNLSGGLVQRYKGSSIVRQAIHVSELYQCKKVRLVHGHASSGTNNTNFAFDLIYINPNNASQKRFIGTMAKHKRYNGFGGGDDDTNFVLSPGCAPE